MHNTKQADPTSLQEHEPKSRAARENDAGSAPSKYPMNTEENVETLHCARCASELAILSASSFLCDSCVIRVAAEAIESNAEPLT